MTKNRNNEWMNQWMNKRKEMKWKEMKRHEMKRNEGMNEWIIFTWHESKVGFLSRISLSQFNACGSDARRLNDFDFIPHRPGPVMHNNVLISISSLGAFEFWLNLTLTLQCWFYPLQECGWPVVPRGGPCLRSACFPGEKLRSPHHLSMKT